MASQTSSVSGNVITYTITDQANNTATIVQTNNPVSGTTCTFSSSGGLRPDGLNMMAQMLLQIATGLVIPTTNQPQ